MNLRKLAKFVTPVRRSSSHRGNCDYFITTPIFYVNALPHIGHLHSAVLADASHRFKLLLGYESTVFSTGTDEHGIKIQQAAQASKSDPKAYCDRISSEYVRLFKKCDIGYTDFIRTTYKEHILAVQYFWDCLVKSGCISSGSYKGWYCDADESFLTENQLKTVVENGREVKVSGESGRAVTWVEEENFKFDLPKFHDDLLRWLKTDGVVQPKRFQNLLIQWMEEGLTRREVSVSRPKSRVHWGIPVPGHPEQTVYVWLDALVNYLTASGYPLLRHWPPDVQVIGKDILKFHGIYWPSFLMAVGLEPPRKLMVHSHWTVEGEKMSKSRGNVVCPSERLNAYTASGLRYFLLREATPHSDSNYSDEKVLRVLNSELADTLGNLLSRCCGKKVNQEQVFPPFNQEDFDLYCKDSASDLVVAVNRLPDEVGLHYMDFNFYRGISTIISTLHEANKFFEEAKPWSMRKEKERERELLCVLHLTMEALRICGIALIPVVPSVADTLLTKLGVPLDRRRWEDLTPSWDRDPDTSISLWRDSVVLYHRIVEPPVFLSGLKQELNQARE